MRWVDVEAIVEVVVVGGPMDKYRSATGSETSLVGIGVG